MRDYEAKVAERKELENQIEEVRSCLWRTQEMDLDSFGPVRVCAQGMLHACAHGYTPKHAPSKSTLRSLHRSGLSVRNC